MQQELRGQPALRAPCLVRAPLHPLAASVPRARALQLRRHLQQLRWIKSYVGSSAPVSGAGAFSFPDWASNAAVSPTACRRSASLRRPFTRAGLLGAVGSYPDY